jgi:hypothetical protein
VPPPPDRGPSPAEAKASTAGIGTRVPILKREPRARRPREAERSQRRTATRENRKTARPLTLDTGSRGGHVEEDTAPQLSVVVGCESRTNAAVASRSEAKNPIDPSKAASSVQV